MKNELFIYLTNKDELNLVGGGYPIAPPLDKKAPFYLLPSQEQKPELDDSCIPVAILVLDETNIELFNKEISKISDKYSAIYVAYHTQGIQNTDITRECSFFKDKIKFMGIQHFPPDPIYSTAIDFINATNEVEIQKIIERTRQEFERGCEQNERLRLLDDDPFKHKKIRKNL